jgi:hypothetical protein
LKENEDDIATVDDIFEAVGEHIQGFADQLNKQEVDIVCQNLYTLLHDGLVY